jgi:hypothetical protein
MLIRLCLAALTAAAFIGCANVTNNTAAVEPPHTIKIASGRYVCAVHRVALVTLKGYRDPSLGCSFPLLESDRKRETQNPNRIPDTFSGVRTKECAEATEISYCPSCQAAMEGLSVYYGDNRNF